MRVFYISRMLFSYLRFALEACARGEKRLRQLAPRWSRTHAVVVRCYFKDLSRATETMFGIFGG